MTGCSEPRGLFSLSNILFILLILSKFLRLGLETKLRGGIVRAMMTDGTGEGRGTAVEVARHVAERRPVHLDFFAGASGFIAANLIAPLRKACAVPFLFRVAKHQGI